MNIIAYCALQKKAAPKPAAPSQPPNATAHSEAGPANVPAETKAEPSGAQHNVEVRAHFVHLAAGTHNNSCSQVNRPDQKLVPPMLPTKRKLSLLVHKTMQR